MYQDVADNPKGEFHFFHGREVAEMNFRLMTSHPLPEGLKPFGKFQALNPKLQIISKIQLPYHPDWKIDDYTFLFLSGSHNFI
jgi:hypothetical protein